MVPFPHRLGAKPLRPKQMLMIYAPLHTFDEREAAFSGLSETARVELRGITQRYNGFVQQASQVSADPPAQ